MYLFIYRIYLQNVFSFECFIIYLVKPYPREEKDKTEKEDKDVEDRMKEFN